MAMFVFGGVLVLVLVAAVMLAITVGRNAAVVCAVAAVLLLGLTFYEAQLSDRWVTSNITAEEFAKRFSGVPMDIGDWQGEDLVVEDRVRTVAGAEGFVSREYRNRRTGEKVSLWLIVGHSRDICRHTPDICYPSSGFRMQGEHNSKHTMTFDDTHPADFWTNTFLKEDVDGRAMVRVFWSWYKPNRDGTISWEAPEYQRLHFGNSRALYKMYFTSPMTKPTQTADESPCIQFAQIFLPEVNRALTSSESGSATSADETTNASTTSSHTAPTG